VLRRLKTRELLQVGSVGVTKLSELCSLAVEEQGEPGHVTTHTAHTCDRVRVCDCVCVCVCDCVCVYFLP